jgi:hypothetical protein
MKLSEGEYAIAASELKSLGITRTDHAHIIALLEAGAQQVEDGEA